MRFKLLYVFFSPRLSLQSCIGKADVPRDAKRESKFEAGISNLGVRNILRCCSQPYDLFASRVMRHTLLYVKTPPIQGQLKSFHLNNKALPHMFPNPAST